MWLTKFVRALDHDLDHDLDRGLKRLRAKTLGKAGRAKKGAPRKSTEDFRIFRAGVLTRATPIPSEWTPAEPPDDETA